ncbi:MAG: DNA polymerase III subunit delta [Actinomycetota bacterium]
MSVHVVKGDDPILRSDALEVLVADLVGADDRSLAVEDLTVPGKGGEGEAGGADARQAVVAAAVNAAQSPPFMTASRVVVLREVGNLLTGDVAPLVECVADLLDTTELVFVAGGGAAPPALAKAWKEAGAQEHGAARTKAEDVLAAAAADAGITLRSDATRAVLDRVGSETGRIPAIVEVLGAAYGAGAPLGADDVAPYLGESGGVPPYVLTNAIEEGDVAGALEVLQRVLNATGPQQPKAMHPLQVLAMLHNHLRRIARLDHPEVRTTEDAVAALGGKVKEFPARKALEQSRRLGSEGIREAYAALAQADLDLKGARAIPEQAVMEILVARLAALSARSGGSRSRRGPVRARR